ncbi:MAG: hypothetical protein WAT39_18550 [Planctomycetota bacterium]
MRSRTRALPFLVLVLVLNLPTTGAGQEPQPAPARDGRRLVYELPVDAMQRALQHTPELDLEQALDRAVRTVAVRLGERVVVRRSTGTGFTVDVPPDLVPGLAALRSRIETGGKLEMRVVADADFVSGPVRFDLQREKERLQAWLADPEHRKLVQQDPHSIARFNDDAHAGPVSTGNLAWYPRKLRPDPKNQTRWENSWSEWPSMQRTLVQAFDDTQWNGGAVPDAVRKQPAHEQYLVELVALNLKETHFTGADLDPKRVRAGPGAGGDVAVNYAIHNARAGDYADWSEKYIGKHSAIVWDGFVRSAPMFRSKIPGRGVIQGAFTQLEADGLAFVLQSGPLPVPPKFVAEEPLPAGEFAPAGK